MGVKLVRIEFRIEVASTSFNYNAIVKEAKRIMGLISDKMLNGECRA